MRHIKNVLPTFHIIAESKLVEDGIRGFFSDIDPKFFTNLEEKNKTKLSDVEKLCEVVGNISKTLPSSATKNNKEYISKINNLDLLEHTQVTIAFNNVSQNFIDKFFKMKLQIHINQRELENEQLKFWLLPTYEDEEKLALKFAELFESFGTLKATLERELLTNKNRNIQKDIESIKRLLPNSYALDAIMTTSLLNWKKIICEYTSLNYDDELRYILLLLAKTFKSRYQNIFQDIVLVDPQGNILGIDSLKVDGKMWRNLRVKTI